jgi:hypothetical protein
MRTAFYLTTKSNQKSPWQIVAGGRGAPGAARADQGSGVFLDEEAALAAATAAADGPPVVLDASAREPAA